MTEHPKIPELAGTYPIVLYFGSQADADEFIAIVQLAKPGLVARSLAPIGKTAEPPLCNCRKRDAWRCAVDRHLSTVSCHCVCHRQPIPKV